MIEKIGAGKKRGEDNMKTLKKPNKLKRGKL